MPDYIDTREPGWRRTTRSETEWPRAIARIEYFEEGREIGWVREEPRLTLPTEPYTVIRVTWATGARKGAQDILVNHLGGWCDLEGTIYDRRTAAESITGFELLSVPHAGAAGVDD